MGDFLYRRWLEEEVVDLQKAILYGGINGLLFEFERWLEEKGYLKEKTKWRTDLILETQQMIPG